MSAIRRIAGTLWFPATTMPGERVHVRVELHDASLMDVASRVLASVDLGVLTVSPHVQLSFVFDAPEGGAGDSFIVRAVAAGKHGTSPRYLTTRTFRVPARGDVDGLSIDLEKV
jgi:hypothetical protein